MLISTLFTLLLNFENLSFSTNNCEDFYRYTWTIKDMSIQRSYRHSAPDYLCIPLPTSELQNGLLEIRDSHGTKIYEQPVQYSSYTIHENSSPVKAGKSQKPASKMTGSVIKNQSPSFTALIPKHLDQSQSQITLIDIKTKNVIGEGRL